MLNYRVILGQIGDMIRKSLGTVFVFMTYISYTGTLTDFSKDITLQMNEIERYTGIFNSICKLIIGRKKNRNKLFKTQL
jgi:hypothetical protein